LYEVKILEQTTLFTLLVGILLIVSAFQAVQLGDLSANQQKMAAYLASRPAVYADAAPAAASQAPSSSQAPSGGIGSLPSQVGGC
jgi:hypothetical protein